MRKAPTLADTVYAATFSKRWDGALWADRLVVRDAIQKARKFILDDSMSAFLGELSSVAFLEDQKPAIKFRSIEQMRTSARLPHAATWVEFNLKKEIARSNEIKATKIDPELAPDIEGWLMEQHPECETTFCASIFLHADDPDEAGFKEWIFPFSYIWSTSDEPPAGMDDDGGRFYRVLPEKFDNIPTSSVLCGLSGYDTDKVACGLSRFQRVDKIDQIGAENLIRLLVEWMGVLRRIWALMATINDIPVLTKDVRPSKGFIARGRYRQFLEHKVITLTVPVGKDTRSIARSAVAAARRRAHQVRGHWRHDWRHPGERLWIREHQRGDASRGFVTHDYAVERGQDERA